MDKKLQFAGATLVLIILLTGFWARFKDLDWHFTTVDDRGVAEIIFKNRAQGSPELFPIPSFYTYAPLQFVLTPLLISENQGYRELLWRGRLPSALAGCLALALCVILYLRMYSGQVHRMLLPLVLLACSWENIIYAKQMHNYAIGVTGVILLFYTLWVNLEKPDFGLRRMFFNAFVCALVSHMQYQIMSMIPPFFLILLIYGWRRAPDRKKLLFNVLAGGAAYAALVFPMGFFFLRKHMALNAGAPAWAYGTNREFILEFGTGMAAFEKLLHAAAFYVRNLFITFQANTAFVSENHALFEPAGFALFVLFVFGIIRFFRREDVRGRFLGLYIVMVFAVWFVLVFTGKLTLSPTRHALVYLPFMAVTAGEGLLFLFQKREGSSRSEVLGAAGVSFVILLLFMLNYGKFLEERRDPFVEEEILEVLERFEVDAIGTNVRTDGLSLMPKIEAYKQRVEMESKGSYKTLAWISRWDVGFNKKNCDEMREVYNLMQEQASLETGVPHMPISEPCASYKVIYSRRHNTDLQVDYSRKTRIPMYTNSFYFYVASRDPETIKKAGV